MAEDEYDMLTSRYPEVQGTAEIEEGKIWQIQTRLR